MSDDELKIGYYYDLETDTPHKDLPLSFGGETHVLLFGVNGAGKSTRILIENLVTMRGRSLVVFDIKGELAAQTLRARRRLGDAKIVNPFNLHNLGSDGFNPLAALDPHDDEFFDKAKELTSAMVESEGEKANSYFVETARRWLCAGVMWEVKEAFRECRTASLLRAREWCLEPDDWKELPDGSGRKIQTAGVTFNAKRAVKEGGRQIANLASSFAHDELNRSDRDVLQTLATQTEFLISNAIERDLQTGNWSFAQLKHRVTAVYIVLPPNRVQDQRRWTRLLMTCALHDHLKPGPLRTLFVMDEFRVSIGHLAIVNDFWALVRGYGVSFMPVCQSVTQLKALFGDEWENYAGQSGLVATLGAPGDRPTAQWMSDRSGTTTIWKEGRNIGESQNTGGAGSSEGESYQQIGVPFLSPQEMMNLKRGTGIIWLQGMGDKCIPFAAPNYWQRPAIKPLVDPNPYREGAGASVGAGRSSDGLNSVSRDYAANRGNSLGQRIRRHIWLRIRSLAWEGRWSIKPEAPAKTAIGRAYLRVEYWAMGLVRIAVLLLLLAVFGPLLVRNVLVRFGLMSPHPVAHEVAEQPAGALNRAPAPRPRERHVAHHVQPQ